MQAINNQPITYICTIHALKYGKIKVPSKKPTWKYDYCCACRAEGLGDIFQSVTTPDYYEGLVGENVTTIKNTEGL